MKSLLVTLAAMTVVASAGILTGGAPVVPATVGSNAFVSSSTGW